MRKDFAMATAKSDSPCDLYQFHVLLLHMGPAIWRRVLIRSDSSIADLHYALQIVMGWDDMHLQYLYGEY